MRLPFFLLLLGSGWVQQSWGQDVNTDTLVIADSANTSLQVAEGVASYYHNKFEGRLMANGAIFSQSRLTAAHNTLPLNTWVQVTNLSNGKTVVVKITDRMHPKNKRLIDLSRAAAIRLGYIRKGLTRVKVVPLGPKRPLEADLQWE